MNIPLRLEITLAFDSVMTGHNLEITNLLDKHNLYLESFGSYTDTGLYFFRYVLKGEPAGMISFLQDDSIVSNLI